MFESQGNQVAGRTDTMGEVDVVALLARATAPWARPTYPARHRADVPVDSESLAVAS